MTVKRGDRFGGVVFDIQQHRKGVPCAAAGPLASVQRMRLIMAISMLIELVEEMDHEGLMTNIDKLENPNRAVRGNYLNTQEARSARMAAKAAGVERCSNTEHFKLGQRKTDCTECFPPEQASITTSLADLTSPMAKSDPPKDQSVDWSHREPPRIGKICECSGPVCNGDGTFPKGCYECGGIVLAPEKK